MSEGGGKAVASAIQRGERPSAAPTVAGRSAQPGPARSPAAKPAPPLALKPPPEPAPIFERTDLKKVPAARLAAVARRLYDDKQYVPAIQLLHYAIRAGPTEVMTSPATTPWPEIAMQPSTGFRSPRSTRASTPVGRRTTATWRFSRKDARVAADRPLSRRLQFVLGRHRPSHDDAGGSHGWLQARQAYRRTRGDARSRGRTRGIR